MSESSRISATEDVKASQVALPSTSSNASPPNSGTLLSFWRMPRIAISVQVSSTIAPDSGCSVYQAHSGIGDFELAMLPALIRHVLS